ncbi:hypothetical protein GOV10_06825 [Candidatus Woesearchaeota archaeon]|nr:hypothetical protein [Candidatus Woesearchaeota archaeon]
MWLAKYKIKHGNCLLTPLCTKHNVTDFVYLLNSWKTKKHFHYTEIHILQGTEENKKKFLKELKKQETIKKVEQTGNYIFTLNEEPPEKEYYTLPFDPRFIQTRPIAVKPDGFEYWELACWDKKPLMTVLEVPVFKVEIKSLKKTKISDIFLPSIYPKLAPKQKVAIELAVKEGYYEYPREIDLEGLAKIANVKRQTIQENLRRAEKKLVPFLTENIS